MLSDSLVKMFRSVKIASVSLIKKYLQVEFRDNDNRLTRACRFFTHQKISLWRFETRVNHGQLISGYPESTSYADRRMLFVLVNGTLGQVEAAAR